LLKRHESNKVDVQDYNEQVIRYITIPNILLNTALTIQDPTTNDLPPDENNEDEEEEEEEEEDEEEDDEDDEDDEKAIVEHTCDGEAEIPTDKISDILSAVSKRTRAFMGDWSSLPVSIRNMTSPLKRINSL
jgi:protein-histidine N-methyltransferase